MLRLQLKSTALASALLALLGLCVEPASGATMAAPLSPAPGASAARAAAPAPAPQRRRKGRGSAKGKKGGGSLFKSQGGRLPALGPGLDPDLIPERRPLGELGRGSSADAPLEPVLDLVDEAELAGWFGDADLDTNSWISFREARSTMEFDRNLFRVYDVDKDGRIRTEEFELFYRDRVQSGNGFEPPHLSETVVQAPRRTPEQLRIAYDRDLDKRISLYELSYLLGDYQRLDSPAEEVLRLVDSNQDEMLNLAELVSLSSVLYPVAPPSAEQLDGLEGVPASSVLELFGQAEPRGERQRPEPPRIVGPVPTFRRLDLDGDGFIERTDLEELLRPTTLGIRPAAVLATLDVNGDGKLSESEFRRAFARVAD